MFTESKLTASDPIPAGNFGQNVSISGDYAIVGRGEPFDLNQGAAYIFFREGSGWTQQAKLASSDAAPFDAFGASVSIDGDYAAVGAAGTLPHGKVYVFHRDDKTWNELTQPLTPSDGGNASTFFGRSLSLKGETLVVGTNNAAYVFRRTASGWVEEAKLMDNSTTQTFFGKSVCVDGDHVIIGAPQTEINGKINTGAAYIFTKDGSTWIQQAVLSASDSEANSDFGWSVSLCADYVIVGAPDATSGGIKNAGAAYVFERDGTAWTQVSRLEPADPQVVKSFGWSVSVSTTAFGSHAIVGDRSDFEAGVTSGAAYLFKRNGGTWNLVEPKITASDAAVNAEFGHSVCISGDSILVGAPGHTETEYAQGVAYVYTDFLNLDSAINLSKWKIYATILFGLIGGGGGVIILPGGGGGPVDPEPFRRWMTFSPAKRDAYITLMIRDIANLIDDKEGKQEIKTAATNLRKKAARKLPEFKGIARNV